MSVSNRIYAPTNPSAKISQGTRDYVFNTAPYINKQSGNVCMNAGPGVGVNCSAYAAGPVGQAMIPDAVAMAGKETPTAFSNLGPARSAGKGTNCCRLDMTEVNSRELAPRIDAQTATAAWTFDKASRAATYGGYAGMVGNVQSREIARRANSKSTYGLNSTNAC